MLKFSRVLSLLLSLVLIINLVPVYAEEEDVLDASNEAAVEEAIGSDTLAHIKDRLIHRNSDSDSVNLFDSMTHFVDAPLEKLGEIVSTSNMSLEPNDADIMTTTDTEIISVPTNVESKKQTLPDYHILAVAQVMQAYH